MSSHFNRTLGAARGSVAHRGHRGRLERGSPSTLGGGFMACSSDDQGELLTSAVRAELGRVDGIVFDIQRYSVHDGPGLRTNVFFKGCSLRLVRCAWCANPESQAQEPELAVFAANCIRCGQFEQPCPDAWQPQREHGWRAPTQAEYEARVEQCPAGGVRRIGDHRKAGSVMDEVRRDTPLYAEGGG